MKDFCAIIVIGREEGMKSRLPAAFHKILGCRVIDYMLADLAKIGPKQIFAVLEDEGHLEYVENAAHAPICKVGATVEEIMAEYGEMEYKVIRGAQIEGFSAITDRRSLAEAANGMMRRINNGHMENGVTIIDHCNTYIGPDVKIGMDTVIYPGAIIEGTTTIGEGCTIGQNCRLVDTKIGDDVEIWQSVCLESAIGDNSAIGPFAYLRPGSAIGKNCRIGDFVEVKNAVMGDGSKASHLSYIGDAVIGENVNIGCGVITVNFDGIEKHLTVVEDGAFIGCNTNLVAPVTVGRGAYTAAGSTITHDVPADALGVARGRQKDIAGWAAKRRK